MLYMHMVTKYSWFKIMEYAYHSSDPTEAVTRRCSWKFCKFQRKTPVLESPFTKVPELQACNSIKMTLQHKCYTVKYGEFLRTPFFTKHLQWLLLIPWILEKAVFQNCSKRQFTDRHQILFSVLSEFNRIN